jgi:hypothetical protein
VPIEKLKALAEALDVDDVDIEELLIMKGYKVMQKQPQTRKELAAQGSQPMNPQAGVKFAQVLKALNLNTNEFEAALKSGDGAAQTDSLVVLLNSFLFPAAASDNSQQPPKSAPVRKATLSDTEKPKVGGAAVPTTIKERVETSNQWWENIFSGKTLR